ARDLQLEAIAEILEGKRVIHCHSYVKGEVLEVLRVAEEFGVKIGTLQHILEGYKVADEIAKHGAGASTFSDWWAYKFEVYDAIPYNGALMRERGVVVSFNSDSNELARRLNFEAAKAVHYGAMPREAALAFVTSNPARQLGIEKRVGSLEAGKDADFVVWSGDPLSTSSMALETWIEGKKEFDRAADLMLRPAHEKERADLIAKAKKKTEPARQAEPPRTDEKPPADRARPAEAPARPTV
ncbi:MAG: amidohydrolase family protein, partial [Thermoanaerobaculia bacterium]